MVAAPQWDINWLVLIIWGGVELDPAIANIYKENHHPKYLFCEDIRDFNGRENLPAELYQLDILDGSPPCSTFSMAGDREAAWGKEKRFAEGQKKQRLDDLVFVYCDTIIKLQPKTFILENVSGLVKGNAKSYVARILKKMKEAGYDVQVFLLDSSTMGVPQARQRTFIIGRQSELKWPNLKLQFSEKPIPFGRIIDRDDNECNLSPKQRQFWPLRKKGDTKYSDIYSRNGAGNSGFTQMIVSSERVSPTLTTGDITLYDIPRYMNKNEYALVSSFPMDYKFHNKHRFLCGMSVPPVMTAQVAYQMYLQWFKV